MPLTELVVEKAMEDGIAYARHHALPLLIFETQTTDRELATGSIVQTTEGYALVTAKHVIERLEEWGERGRMQIGRDAFVVPTPPSAQIRKARSLDVGMILMNEKFVLMNRWPVIEYDRLSSRTVKKGDLTTYVGYPGATKSFSSAGNFLSPLAFAAMVETVEPDQFSMRCDPQRYETDMPVDKEMHHIGGISGAPIFKVIEIDGGRLRRPLLVGWVHEGMAWSQLEQKHYATPLLGVAAWFGMS
jgi:hypothetical protein